MPYITFLSIGLGSRTDSSVTTIMFFAIVRACAGFFCHHCWWQPQDMAPWIHSKRLIASSSGSSYKVWEFLDQTGIWGPWSEDKDQISMAMDQNHGTLVNIKIAGIYIYVYISGCSPPKAWYYRFWLIPISTSMKWSLVTSSLSTHRLQDSTASLNGSQWYDGYELFPTFQAQWSSSGPL
jgi:hypothetical protein